MHLKIWERNEGYIALYSSVYLNPASYSINGVEILAMRLFLNDGSFVDFQSFGNIFYSFYKTIIILK